MLYYVVVLLCTQLNYRKPKLNKQLILCFYLLLSFLYGLKTYAENVFYKNA